jgi:hypothetical protein
MNDNPAPGPVGETATARRGYFVRRPVRAGEMPGLMRTHIITGAMANGWGNLVSGVIYIFLGNALGMTQLQWGILGGITAWVVILQPVGAVLGERSRSRKLVWFWTSLSDRVLRLVGIVGAYFMWRAGNHNGYLLFMAGVCIASAVGNLSQGPWFGWFATIIRPEVQGTFWGRRDSWISFVVILVALPSGFIMDLIPRSNKVEAALFILIFGSLLGYGDILIHATIPEPPEPGPKKKATFEGILVPLKDQRFRPWLVFAVAWNFAQNLGGSLCVLYFMENLGFRNNLLGGTIAINGIGLAGTLFAARRVGRMVDRYGIKRMLLLGHTFWSILPAIWLLATPTTALLWVGVASLVGGVFPAAANNAGIKLITRFTRPEESGMYMAFSTAVSSISAGLGAIAAGAFVNSLQGWSMTLFGLVLSGFPLLFIISFALRLVVSLVLIPRVKLGGPATVAEQPFLLPLFFERVPGINRLVRQQRGLPPGGPVGPDGKPLRRWWTGPERRERTERRARVERRTRVVPWAGAERRAAADRRNSAERRTAEDPEGGEPPSGEGAAPTNPPRPGGEPPSSAGR